MTLAIDVSCVIPTHGRVALLRESLGSVVDQATTASLQIVVVDDLGNTDTREVVEEFERLHPGVSFVYVHRVEGSPGASASRNYGASLAVGDVLAFLDDDDLWEPSHLENALEISKRTSNELVLSWMKVIERDGHVSDHYAIEPGLQVKDVVARNRGITGSNIVISRSAFHDIGGFDEALPVSNDKDLLVQYLLSGRRYSVSRERSSYHRRHSSDQLTSWDERRARGLELYMKKYSSIASSKDSRYLSRQIHSIRARTASSRFARARHALQLIGTSEPTDLFSRAIARLKSRMR